MFQIRSLMAQIPSMLSIPDVKALREEINSILIRKMFAVIANDPVIGSTLAHIDRKLEVRLLLPSLCNIRHATDLFSKIKTKIKIHRLKLRKEDRTMETVEEIEGAIDLPLFRPLLNFNLRHRILLHNLTPGMLDSIFRTLIRSRCPVNRHVHV